MLATPRKKPRWLSTRTVSGTTAASTDAAIEAGIGVFPNTLAAAIGVALACAAGSVTALGRSIAATWGALAGIGRAASAADPLRLAASSRGIGAPAGVGSTAMRDVSAAAETFGTAAPTSTPVAAAIPVSAREAASEPVTSSRRIDALAGARKAALGDVSATPETFGTVAATAMPFAATSSAATVETDITAETAAPPGSKSGRFLATRPLACSPSAETSSPAPAVRPELRSFAPDPSLAVTNAVVSSIGVEASSFDAGFAARVASFSRLSTAVPTARCSAGANPGAVATVVSSACGSPTGKDVRCGPVSFASPSPGASEPATEALVEPVVPATWFEPVAAVEISTGPSPAMRFNSEPNWAPVLPSPTFRGEDGTPPPGAREAMAKNFIS